MAYQIHKDDEQNRMQVKILSYGQTGDLWMRSKGQISLNFGYHVNFKILCVFSQMKDTKHIRQDFYSVNWGHGPGVGLCGTGGAQGVKLFFSNMVMWHIKSTGMTSRTECK